MKDGERVPHRDEACEPKDQQSLVDASTGRLRRARPVVTALVLGVVVAIGLLAPMANAQDDPDSGAEATAGGPVGEPVEAGRAPGLPGPVEAAPRGADAELPVDPIWMPFVGEFRIWCTIAIGGTGPCASHHTGWAVDIDLPWEHPVYAAGSGVIRVADGGCNPRGGDLWCNNRAGNYVAIQHDSAEPGRDDYLSRYIHLAVIAPGLEPGDEIKAGDLVGWAGASGTSDGGVHLHYDETTPYPERRMAFGPMLACHGTTAVQYPDVLGVTDWRDVPYGSELRNDGYECLGGVTVDPPDLPVEVGNVGGSNGTVAADFNADGRADLAIGVPGEDEGDAADAGFVSVSFGGAAGAWSTPLPLRQGTELLGNREAGDLSGAALATGDFNCDGVADLAVGAPGEDLDAVTDAGAVNLVYGGANLNGQGALLTQQQGLQGPAAAGDMAGAALASGDFNGDGCADLAVGAPGDDTAAAETGIVNVVLGAASGTPLIGPDLVLGDTVAGTPGERDRFGTALAAGDFDCDGVDDLAIGAPGTEVVKDGYGYTKAGAAYVVYGVRGAGLTGPSVMLAQEVSGLDGILESQDWLGLSLAAGNFGKGKCDDLAIGVPGEDVVGEADGGAVNVVYGSRRGLRSAPVLFQSEGLRELPERGDRLGTSLGVADVDCNGLDDLVIGVEGEALGGKDDAGVAHVVRGSSQRGLQGRGQLLSQRARSMGGKPEVGDMFGSVVAAGDFDGNGCQDLAVASPGEALQQLQRVGAVAIRYLGATDLRRQVLRQGSGIADTIEAGDLTGSPAVAWLLGVPLEQ